MYLNPLSYTATITLLVGVYLITRGRIETAAYLLTIGVSAALIRLHQL